MKQSNTTKLILLLTTSAAGVAGASTVDLSASGSFGTINNALFEQGAVRTAGTGVIDPFLRLQATGVEQGYNTSGRPAPFDDLSDPNFTTNLQFSELTRRTIGGTEYFEFLLDVNEPLGGTNELVSLDMLNIYTNSTGSLTSTNLSDLGTPRYDLDAGMDSVVILNAALTSGSGESDARIFIPVTNFAGTSASDFVYLYAKFGQTNPSGDGFEEFAIQNGSATAIPLPAACSLAIAGLAGVGAMRRRSV